jgi:hypothetical protein
MAQNLAPTGCAEKNGTDADAFAEVRAVDCAELRAERVCRKRA